MVDYRTYLDEGLTDAQLILKREFIEQISVNPHVTKGNIGAGYVTAHSSLEQFIDKIKEAIDEDQGNKKNRIFFLDNYSKVNVFEDPLVAGKDALGIVGYHLRTRVPGTTAATNRPGDPSRRETRSHLRAITYDAVEKPQQATFHFGKWFDNILCFDIFAKSNKEANEVAMWFEDLMDKNRQFFAYSGIMKYHFEERESDAIKKDGDSIVHIRPMLYWVRTEKNYEIDEQAINNIVVKITTT